MRNTQYIVVGTADSDKIEAGYPALCLLTRRVFPTLEAAQAFISDPSMGRHRTGQIVECYFAIPDSLYRQDWVPAGQKVVVEVSGGVAEVTECPEGVDVEIIDHDNIEGEMGMKCKTCGKQANSLLGGECIGCAKEVP